MKQRAPITRTPSLALCALVLVLAGCGALPDKPQRPVPYDLGPLVAPTSVTPVADASPLAVGEVNASADLDRRLMVYRLLYADGGQQLRPYGNARWSMPAPALVGQRLRAALAATRPVVEPDGNLAAQTLQTELEEFTHEFRTPESSEGVVQLRATLTARGARQQARVVAQRTFVSRQPAATPNAAGGAAALRAATDDVVRQIVTWLDSQPAPASR